MEQTQNIYNKDDYSCLYIASIICLPNFVKKLLEYGAKAAEDENNFIELLEFWIYSDRAYRVVKDGVDRNKNMEIIINLIKDNK